MNFSGFQKLTLLDYPGKVACTLFTAGCNLRCPFCHNASLVTHIDSSNIYKKEEILSYLKKRHGILEGVCISGGEPLLQAGIEDFIKEIKDIGYSVKLPAPGRGLTSAGRAARKSVASTPVRRCVSKWRHRLHPRR